MVKISNAVIVERIDGMKKDINHRLDDIHIQLTKLNGKVSEHEQYITGRKVIYKFLKTLMFWGGGLSTFTLAIYGIWMIFG